MTLSRPDLKPAATCLRHQAEPEPTAGLLITQETAASCAVGSACGCPASNRSLWLSQSRCSLCLRSVVILLSMIDSSGKSAISFYLWVDVHVHSTHSLWVTGNQNNLNKCVEIIDAWSLLMWKIRFYVWNGENGFTEFCLPVHLLTGFQETGRENQGELLLGCGTIFPSLISIGGSF